MNGVKRVSALLAVFALSACAKHAMMQANVPVPADATLKDTYRNAFLVGTALNPRMFNELDSMGVRIVTTQFNATTPENVLKWEVVHPLPTQYSFTASDQYVAFGERHGMKVIGHTLVWHSQTPAWVFQDSAKNPLTRDALLARMRDHIVTVVGHYKGRINGWDVVNEALNEDGTMRQSPWYRIIGEDFIVKAFQFAHEADPSAELFYNDYNLATPAKRDGAIRIAKQIRAAGGTITAINSQDHHKIDVPSIALVDSMFLAFRNAGFHANVTELDVDVLPRVTPNNTADVSTRAQMTANANPFVGGLPDSMQVKLSHRYADLFRTYLKYQDIIDRVTFWGVTDGDSWLNGFPVRGRTNHALLFDRQGMKKPAFDAVISVELNDPHRGGK